MSIHISSGAHPNTKSHFTINGIKCENYFGQKKEMQRVFALSSQPCPEVPLAAAVTNSLSNTNIEHLWGRTFF